MGTGHAIVESRQVDTENRREKMARQRKAQIPDDFPVRFPEGWSDFVKEKFAELYTKAETEEFEVYELQHATTGIPAPFRLIIGKYGPVWQNTNNRGQFITFEDEDEMLAHGFRLAVVKKTVTIDLVHNNDKLGLKIKRMT